MSVNLSQQDMDDLMKQGYSLNEIQKAMGDIEKEDLQQGVNTATNSASTISNATQSTFRNKQDMNDIAKWQLELNDILERAEHILRGDIAGKENGKPCWLPNPNPDQNALNEYGVRLLMCNLYLYINRHIILGDYEEDEIRPKVYDFGKKINDLIYKKYEKLGMDREEKRAEYQLIVLNMTNLVHGAYKRALKGGERRSLREMININQNHQLNGMNNGMNFQNPQMQQQQQQPRSIINPMRYIRGKYG